MQASERDPDVPFNKITNSHEPFYLWTSSYEDEQVMRKETSSLIFRLRTQRESIVSTCRSLNSVPNYYPLNWGSFLSQASDCFAFLRAWEVSRGSDKSVTSSTSAICLVFLFHFFSFLHMDKWNKQIEDDFQNILDSVRTQRYIYKFDDDDERN